ncbi:helix-turn-helix domain-containing protein [Streptomyces sp. NPDC050315]|uniref:PucR family transcriptional regulator n=1 Tax=Streptomyces sp. NPDC050315 TaxID=3155039 RepID=UPI003447A8F7
MLQELQEIVNRVAADIGVPTSLTDTRLNSLVFGPHDDEEIDAVRRQALLRRSTPDWVREWFGRYGIETATAPVRIPADPEQGLAGRVVVPVRWAQATYGYICLLDARYELDESRLDAVVEAASEAGHILHSDRQDRHSDADLLSDLVRGTAAARDKAAARLGEQGRSPVGWPVAALFLQLVEGADGTDALERWLWRDSGALPRGALRCLDDDGAVVLIPVPVGEEAAHAVRIAEQVRGSYQDASTLVVGVGEAQSDVRDAHLSYQHARLAAHAATVWPQTGPVCSWDALGALRALIATPENLLGAVLDPRVERLRRDQPRDLINTLETYLDSGCDIQATAAQLHVHRGTVYYRLGRAAAACGLDLGDGMDRLALHLGIKLMRLIDSTAV